MSEDSNLPLSELLRPKRIEDLTLPERIISGLQRMFDTQTPDNMLLFGPPGTGKTSTARIFTEQRGFYGTLNVDGSNETGIDNIRTVIEGFASCYPFTPGIKICVIDDADYLSRPAQLIEKPLRTSPFSRPRMTPLTEPRPGGAEPHIAEQSRSWRAASGEWRGYARFLKRQLSLPVSMMSQWCVSRSSMAVSFWRRRRLAANLRKR